MPKVFLIATLMITVAMAIERGSVMADSKGDCTTVLFDMDDCIPFVTAGSEKKKPTKECCSGFKRVLKSNAECVCEALQLSSEMRLGFDRTRVMSLPSACSVSSSYPPIPDCDLTEAPVSAPTPTPTPADEVPVPSPSSEASPAIEPPSEAPSVVGGSSGGSPPSSPSGARVITANPVLFLVGIFALSFLH